MQRWAVATIVLGLLLPLVACGSSFAPDTTPVDYIASTVAIEATGCQSFPAHGIGVVVDDDVVLTVAHVVAGEEAIEVVTADGRRLDATIAAIDTAIDLAVLSIPGLGLEPLPQRPAHLEEPLRRIGLVELDGDERLTAVDVRIERDVTINMADIYREGEFRRAGYEISGAVEQGDSGGPIVSAEGAVVAVVFATSRATEGRAWATDIAEADQLLNSLRTAELPDPVPCSR